jgi:prolyl-tRNA synthetase
MRLSKAFGKTLREAPAEAELISHQLLIRANFVRPVSSGIYTFMPLGFRVLRKIQQIMEEEMDAIGGQEMLMPNLHPADLWQASGRWFSVDVLMKLEGYGGRAYCLSPTHEEIVVNLALSEIESYRDLPQVVYHINKKFRDEPRPRGGMLRLREFIMKDAYSLDTSAGTLDVFYPHMVQAYFNIFRRCGVDALAINADVGAMGGKASQEFVVAHDQGEDMFIRCDNCDYASNVEAAEFVRDVNPPQRLEEIQKLATPDCQTIADVAAYVGVPVEQTIKAVFYWWYPWGEVEANGRVVFGLVRGDLDVNEIKIANALGGGELRTATAFEIEDTGAVPGYASPAGLEVASKIGGPGTLVIADPSIELGSNFVIGANESGYHYTGANYSRDFTVTKIADIAQADTGHQCVKCGGRLEAKRAIEMGHCFKLGTRYSKAVKATYLDERGEQQFIYMGSYGIGLDRLMATIVELHHDQDGIVWPDSVAPYQVHLMHLGKGSDVINTAEKLYDELQKAGIDILFDDREFNAGVKFKDADLMGIPWRIAVGSRGLAEGVVEVKRRDQDERSLVQLTDLQKFLFEQWAE